MGRRNRTFISVHNNRVGTREEQAHTVFAGAGTSTMGRAGERGSGLGLQIGYLHVLFKTTLLLFIRNISEEKRIFWDNIKFHLIFYTDTYMRAHIEGCVVWDGSYCFNIDRRIKFNKYPAILIRVKIPGKT